MASRSFIYIHSYLHTENLREIPLADLASRIQHASGKIPQGKARKRKGARAYKPDDYSGKIETTSQWLPRDIPRDRDFGQDRYASRWLSF